jgi:hypothetical protein
LWWVAVTRLNVTLLFALGRSRIEAGFRYGCDFVAAYSTDHGFAG